MDNNKDAVIVIGGGPAGIMAAVRASQLGAKVCLFEKNNMLGKKLLLTGKGRCNVTNNCSLDEFISRFARNGKFLRDSFKHFFNYDVIEFFESRGVKLKTERQQRVFPESNRSASIHKVLLNELRKNNVEIFYNNSVLRILTKDKCIKSIVTDKSKKIKCKSVILATGGCSYKNTGSTGDGYNISKMLGHTISNIKPALVPLTTKETFPKRISGLSLKNIRLKFVCGNKKIISSIGELLFTEFGISGPLIIEHSGDIVEWLGNGKNVKLFIDIKPGLKDDMLNNKFIREFKSNSKKTLKNYLKTILPHNFADEFAKVAHLDALKNIADLTKQDRITLIKYLKEFPMEIISHYDFDRAMVTRGGVSIKEVNPKTMMSKIIDGLYFAGEILDIDGDTGGFNIQAAFSAGFLAGECAAGKC